MFNDIKRQIKDTKSVAFYRSWYWIADVIFTWISRISINGYLYFYNVTNWWDKHRYKTYMTTYRVGLIDNLRKSIVYFSKNFGGNLSFFDEFLYANNLMPGDLHGSLDITCRSGSNRTGYNAKIAKEIIANQKQDVYVVTGKYNKKQETLTLHIKNFGTGQKWKFVPRRFRKDNW